jgi:hypothetical protein
MQTDILKEAEDGNIMQGNLIFTGDLLEQSVIDPKEARTFKITSTYRIANPCEGKKKTSRAIRRRVHDALRKDAETFDFVNALDRTRGKAGSRDADYGWKYFGDGREVIHEDRERK